MQEPKEGKATAEVSKENAHQLKEQAQLFRQLARSAQDEFLEQPLPGWRKFLYLFLILLVLFSVVFLLIARDTRRQLIVSVGERWAHLYRDEQNEIFKLPPPPPQAAKPKFAVPELSLPAGGAGEEPSGVLFWDQTPFSAGGIEESTITPVAPAKNAANEEAYNFLREQSETIRELANNDISEFEFKAWKPVKDKPPEFWIDLVMTQRSDGQEVHMIWSVNVETGRINALSQAARDWEASQGDKNPESRIQNPEVRITRADS
ncbi:MAG: hypothetical protein ACE5MK_04830 [Acidobacteriota bacterium]